MAIDTRNKRFSILGLHQPVPSLAPDPDGAFTAADRAMWLFLYHGIALGGAAAFKAAWARGCNAVIQAVSR
jgi:hypothetical protein